MQSSIKLFTIAAWLAALTAGLYAEPAAESIQPNVPAAFERNLGQSREDVQFVLRRANTAALLLNDRMIFGVSGPAGVTRATMRWTGANPDARLEALEPLVKKTDYYIGADPQSWVRNVPSFDRIRYGGVYPGIDLEFYHLGAELEYDFIVAAGADPSAIRLTFDSESGIELADDGSLGLTGAGGPVAHRTPILYQMVDGRRQAVAGSFVEVAANEFRFEVSDYDQTQALVIDPRVAAIRQGGSSGEQITGMTNIDMDRIAAVGWTDSADFLETMTPGGRNAFGLVISGMSSQPANPVVEREFVLGGSSVDEAVDVISQGETLLIGGHTNSMDLPFSAASFGDQDAFVAKWSPEGGLESGARFGGAGPDQFVGFGRFSWGGVPQSSVQDYDGDSDSEFYTTARISVGNNEYIQINELSFDDLQNMRERHIFTTAVGVSIQATPMQWCAESHSWLIVGSATANLYPSAMHPGDPGTMKPFLAELPIDAPAPNATPVPLEDVFYFDIPSNGDSDYELTGLALSPNKKENDFPSGMISGSRTAAGKTRGEFYEFDLAGGFTLHGLLSYQSAYPKGVFFNRSFNVMSPMEFITESPSSLGARRFHAIEFQREPFTTTDTVVVSGFSQTNRLLGGLMGPQGSNLFLFGGGDNLPVTSGPTEFGGTSDGWLGRVEFLDLYPDGIVTAGQFQWAPLHPNGIFSVFYNWPRIADSQILGPTNGAYPTAASGMQILVNGEPAGITAIGGGQANFVVHNNVNMMPTATVQLVYDDGVDHFESNTVTMPTTDRWVNMFEAGGAPAGTHSGGFLLENNPLHRDDTLVWYFAGGGSLGDDSILANELTPTNQTFPVTPPLFEATFDNVTYPLNVGYAGNSPGSIAGLFQANVTHPEEFWTAFCAVNTGQTGSYQLKVTDTATGGEQSYMNPVGQQVMPVSEATAFATCP